MLNEVMIKYAELLKEEGQSEEVDLSKVELLPNRFAELEIDRPAFMDSELYAKAADEDVNRLHEKKFPHKPEDMIERAHPESVFVSPALGDGGLVENQNEQQAKIIQMINKLPTGNHVHVHASMIEELVKMANQLEEAGQSEFAETLDEVLASLTGDSKKKLVKEAIGPLAIAGIVALVGGLLGGTGYVGLHGIPESLAEDSSDALDVAEEFPDAFPNSRQYADEIFRGVTNLNRLSAELMRLTQFKDRSQHTIDRISRLVDEIRANYENVNQNMAVLRSREFSAPYVGYIDRLEGHLKSFQSSYNNFVTGLAAAGQAVGRKREELPGRREVEYERYRPEPREVRREIEREVERRPQPLSKPQKAEVQKLLEKVKPGVTELNVNERLGELADKIVDAIRFRTGLTVENLTGERLQYADVNKLKRLLQLAKEPMITIGYTPEGMAG